MNKIKLTTILSFALSLLVLWLTAAVGQTAVTPLDNIVAYVNQDVVTATQLRNQLTMIKQQMTQSGVSIEDKKLRKQVLDQMIDETLVLQKAKELKIEVDDKAVDAAIAQIAKRNNVSMAQLKQGVQEQGMSFKDYRDTIRRQVLLGKAEQQMLGGTVNISKSDVQQFQNKANRTASYLYYVADVVVPVEKSASSQQIQAARQQAQQQLASVSVPSSDVTTASSGSNGINDLGWRSLADLPKVFVESVKTMKVNEVRGPIQAANGTHFLRLVAKKSDPAQPQLTFEQAQQLVFQQKFSEAVKKLAGQLRKSSFVRVV